MPNPITLIVPGTPLYRQVIAWLSTDTDPLQGLVAALGNGVNSMFPNYTTSGPSPDPTLCPRPFLIVAPGGKRAKNEGMREETIVFEVHDDEDHGEARYPGIVGRLEYLMQTQNWRPTDDQWHRYLTGLYFEEASPPFLPDPRYGTRMQQIICKCDLRDTTSFRGYPG